MAITFNLSKICAVFILTVLLAIPLAVSAEGAGEKIAVEELNKELDASLKEAARKRRKASEKAYNLISELMEGATQKQQKHLSLIYSNYNFIETVAIVQKDVGNAITKCGDNNPDMKASLTDRYSKWNEAVEPLMKEARGNLDNMLLAQDYASQKQFDEIFKAIDDTRDLANNQIQKIPVTTPEACSYLKDKMDETQEQMVALLRNTLLSYPQVFSDDAETPDKSADTSKDS